MSCDDTRPKTATECEPCSPAVRNRYFRGKLLTVADYQAEQRYMIHRRRAINRAMLGWGVVSGFEMRLEGQRLEIGPGIALDSAGRELIACEKTRLEQPDDFVWLKKGKCGLEPASAPKPAKKGAQAVGQAYREPNDDGTADPDPGLTYLLSAHYAERQISGVRVSEGCDRDVCETNHVCETVVFSLAPVGLCPPGLPCCRPGPYAEADCRCDAPYGTEAPAKLPDCPADVAARDDRGPQETLCEWSLAWLDGVDPCKVPDLLPEREIELDCGGGVPLACVTIGYDKCDKAFVAKVSQPCGCRRLMRPNELLFDLIRGCDLTVIQDIGWREWHRHPNRPVARRSFYEMFVWPDQPEEPRGGYAPDNQTVHKPPVHTRFWVCFSGPVKVGSLTPEVISMTLVRPHSFEDIGTVLRVPITAILVDERTPGDPPDTTRRFSAMISHKYWHGEIHQDSATGFDCPNQVEIRIDGNRIIDARGQPVDADARGLELPSGNGTRGGEFRSVFVVQKGGCEVCSHEAYAVAADDENKIEPASQSVPETAEPAASK